MILILIALVLSILFGTYFYLSRNFDYWSSRGIKGPQPVVVFGSSWQMFFKPILDLEQHSLANYGNIYGTFFGTKPQLVVADPQLIKTIMVKDFHLFVNRIDNTNEDPIMKRLLTVIMDEEWKNLRSIISPTFSSGKMKKMFKLVEQCVQSLDIKLETVAKNEKEIEMKKLMGAYTMDVIARCAFAMKTDTHNDPNNPFVINSNKLFGSSLRLILFLTLGPLTKLFKISVLDPKVVDFFKNSVKEIVRQRKISENKGQTDFIQLLLDAQKNNSENNLDDKLDDIESHHGIEDKRQLIKNKSPLTDEDILSNGFLFLLAGSETTAKLLSYLIYNLTVYPDCQQKLVEEVLKSHDESGNIDYETVIRLPYLDACISETLRLYPPAVNTNRIVSQDYKLGETGLTLPKGMMVFIPIYAIHHSPQFYPDPQRFDPNRFMPENRDKLVPYTYLPFGAGPRNCVGMRFALMVAKTAIANIITKYKFIRTENTKIPLILKKFMTVHSDITIGVELRTSN